MANNVTPQEPSVSKLLEQLCSRNTPLEIHYHNHTGEFYAAKSRFLGIDNAKIKLDTPQSIGRQVEFAEGQTIDIFIPFKSKILSFRSKILEAGCTVRLNNYHTVNGLYISKPTKILKSQRRHDMRVTSDSIAGIDVTIHMRSEECPSAAPIDGDVSYGRMVNLSNGGCGLSVEAASSSHFTIGHVMFLGFILEGHDGELIFQAEVRNIMGGPPNEPCVRLGMQFLSWPTPAALRRALRPLEQMITNIQRQAKPKSRR